MSRFYACLFCLLLNLALLSATAFARPELAAKKAPQGMPQASTEALGKVEEKFKKMDSDSDAKVSRTEFLAAYPNMREEAFMAIDADKDNYLTAEEWRGFSSGHAQDMGGGAMPGGSPAAKPQGNISSPSSGKLLNLLPPDNKNTPTPENGAKMPLLAPDRLAN